MYSTKGHHYHWFWCKWRSPSFTILLVLSRKSVSFGDILWKTTFWMDDLPLLLRGERGGDRGSSLQPLQLVAAHLAHLRRPIKRILGLLLGPTAVPSTSSSPAP